MRVRYWTNRFDFDDIEAPAARLAQALVERGHHVTAVTLSDRDQLLATSSLNGVAVATVGLRPAVAAGDALAPRLAEAFADHEQPAPDVEHIELAGEAPALALLQLAREPRPAVVTVHSALPDSTADADDIGAIALRTAARVVVDSRALLGQLKAFLADRCAAEYVAPGLPRTEVVPGPRLLRRPRLLCVGPLVRDSGFDVAIDALAAIRERFSTVGLVIVGTGPERAALERRADALGVRGAVEFREPVPLDRLPALVNEASLVLVPARNPVSSSAIAILAGQLLRPVVASSIGGLPEVVEQHGSGLLVLPEDPAALAGAVRRLLAEPGSSADLGRRGRTLARERFGWDRYVGDYERLLREAAAQPPRPVALPHSSLAELVALATSGPSAL